jgi:hypothetical protein
MLTPHGFFLKTQFGGIMRILNLYAGIGGNRKLWPKEHKITAIGGVSKAQ